jgi:hypothetical protein
MEFKEINSVNENIVDANDKLQKDDVAKEGEHVNFDKTNQ